MDSGSRDIGKGELRFSLDMAVWRNSTLIIGGDG